VAKWSSGPVQSGVLLLLLVVACERPPGERFRPQLAVHCLLRVDESTVWVIVNRSYAVDEPYNDTFPDAEVTLARGPDTWPLSYDERSYYGMTLSPPRPSDTYYLRVSAPGFDTVYGRTVVPDTFSILYPREGDTVNLNDSLNWSRSRSCAGYYIAVQSIRQDDTSYYEIAVPNDSFGLGYDSLVVRIPSMFFLYGYREGTLTLPVLAVDSNYYDWVRQGGFGPGGGSAPESHLIGGIGVLGSACQRGITVYYQPDTTPPRR
jgi:hypothetical protein